MKYAFLFILVIFMSCKNEVNNTESTEVADDVNSDKVQLNQELEVYDYDGLRPLINKEDDKIHIVNFWATWCAPCVKELPYFEFINENYKNKQESLMIQVIELSKDYGDVKALDSVSFEVKKGEILGLLGPNGAGKTTTYRILTGYLKPTSGTIKVKDFDIKTDIQEIKKMIGYLPESAPIYKDMLVYD